MLLQAIASIFEGTRIPDELIIIGWRSDGATVMAVEGLLGQDNAYTHLIQSLWITAPGHIPPIEAGLKAASSEFVAIIDDDVTVTPFWLQNLLRHFADPTVGVVGGRVFTPGFTKKIRIQSNAGQITWYGQFRGNVTYLDGDHAFEVASVVECNWCWRRNLAVTLEFDMVLNFESAPNYGIDLTLQAREKGFKVLYDPQASVYHHLAPRSTELDRSYRLRRLFAQSRNYTYIMLTHLQWWQKCLFLVWYFGVGGRNAPGIGVIIAELPNGARLRQREYVVAMGGKFEGLRLWLIPQKRDLAHTSKGTQVQQSYGE
jgi:glycosyltransferase involved in cell wall biosynthesis